MYQGSTLGASAGLAATGMAVGFYVVGAWTLVIAGIALIYTARVLRKRAAQQ